MKKVIFKEEYHGFEDVYDLPRDIEEMWDERFNPLVKGISGEFQGTVKVIIEYEEE
jgi:hypothetical protein